MKLAEALSLRSSLNDRLTELQKLLKDCLVVQEGDKPVASPLEVMEQINATTDELRILIYRINMTNSLTVVDDENLTSLLARRDVLKFRSNSIAEAMNAVRSRYDRYSRSEIKFVTTLNPMELREINDSLAKELRLLDLKIQSIGWSTDLIDV